MSDITQKYNLEEIHGLIRDGDLNVNLTRRSQRDSVNLDYYDEDIKKCLLMLTNDHYVGTKEYPQGQTTVICDVYEIDYRGPKDCVDELYIKFKYSSTWLTLISFHPREYD